MRVALVTSEAGRALGAYTPGSGEVERARLLRDAGHQVTVFVPQTFLSTSPQSEVAWQAEGFLSHAVTAEPLAEGQDRFPRDPALWVSHALTERLQGFDAVWLFAAEWAMPALRRRRFSDRALPVFVLDALPAPDPVLDDLDAMNRAGARRYVLKHADIVGSTDRTPSAWLHQAEELWQQRRSAPPSPVRCASTSPAVTVCVPYFEAPQYLPETLASLEAQTSNDFTVIVVDDGSHTPLAQSVFAECEQRYAERGWRFIRQRNQGSGTARNRAAAEATSEFLLFLDADDIGMPNMVERFLRGALLSGDACLVAPNYGFRDDPNGPCAMLYDPPGNSLIASMGDDMHGGSCIFIRSDAFAQMGGFTEMRGVGFEDYELHIRANLMGLRWDVLPEPIYRYRLPRAGGVSQSTAAYPNLARVRRWYEQLLRPAGLDQMPLAIAALYWRNEAMERKIGGMERAVAPRTARQSKAKSDLKLLLLTCNFPFGLSSGWHNRVQRMIAYFGSRYELTLMTTMPREQLAPLRKEAFQHLKTVLGVEGSHESAATAPGTPFRVREHYTDNFRAALRALPTQDYDAAILDQIFMAESRHDIDTLTVLTEHNIESRLLRQAAASGWKDHPNESLPLHYRNALAEAELLERYEDRAWSDFPLRAAVSEVDRAEMDRRCLGGTTVVAPNGADPASFLRGARFSAETVFFAGHLAYLPNVDAIEFLLAEIWPKVRERRPNAKLILAGRDPAPLVQLAVQRAGAERAGIELCASPVSMDKVAARASVSIAPLRLGSGTRCKILDSLAWGLPVVSTTLGAEGIDVADEEHLLVRDEPGAFAEGIVRLLSDERLWQRLRQNGSAVIRERYSWDRVFQPLEQGLLELLG